VWLQILEQERRNSDDLAVIKQRLDRIESRFDGVERNLDRLDSAFRTCLSSSVMLCAQLGASRKPNYRQAILSCKIATSASLAFE